MNLAENENTSTEINDSEDRLVREKGFIRWGKLPQHEGLTNKEVNDLPHHERIDNTNENELVAACNVIRLNPITNQWESSNTYKITGLRNLQLIDVYKENKIPVELICYDNEVIGIVDCSNTQKILDRINYGNSCIEYINGVTKEFNKQIQNSKLESEEGEEEKRRR